jgi:hypothetical protein
MLRWLVLLILLLAVIVWSLVFALKRYQKKSRLYAAEKQNKQLSNTEDELNRVCNQYPKSSPAYLHCRSFVQHYKALPKKCFDALPKPDILMWDSGFIERHNNCYSYAMQNAELNRARKITPGDLSSEYKNQPRLTRETVSCEALVKRVLADLPDLVYISPEEEHRHLQQHRNNSNSNLCSCEHYKVALVLDRDYWDFHWLRQNWTGLWSHKLGDNEVKEVDAQGHLIFHPMTANLNYDATKPWYSTKKRPHYREICGYFCVPKASRRFAQMEDWLYNHPDLILADKVNPRNETVRLPL